MTRSALISAIAVAIAATAFSVPAAAFQYPSSADQAASNYLGMREQLDAVMDPSPVQLAVQIGSLSGKVLDVAGEIVASTSTNSEGKRTYSYLLQTDGGVTLLVRNGDEVRGVPIGEKVRMLVEVPASASGLDPMQFRCVVRSADLPPPPAAAAAVEPQPPAVQPADIGPAPAGYAAPVSAMTPVPATVSFTVTTDMPAAWMTQDQVERWKQYVMGHNRRLTDQQAEIIVRSIIHYARAFGVDHRLAFALAEAESHFRPDCRSHAGAMGIMQLMPGTAAGLGVKDPWDVVENIRGGVEYLAKQIYSFAGKSNYEQTALGLAAYNAGPGAVRKFGGVPPYTETVNYVRKVTQRFYQLWKDGYP